ncbi:MAG: pyruvate kinase, partial [Gammaproteobacteria bacterium]
MLRRTKIVATIGPGCDDPETLEKVLLAGVNVARLNFSHGSPDDHRRRAQQVRDIAAKHGIYVALLGDLQGPKIRISRFADGKISLTEGAKFTLDSEYDTEAGTQDIVGIDYKELPQDVETGDTLLLDDGRVQLRVLDVVGQKVHTEVILGSELSNNKGINKLGGGISAAALTEKDYEDIKLAAEVG